MSSLGLKIVVNGSLLTVFEQHINDGKRAVTETIKEQTTKLKTVYRAQVSSSFKSRKLPTTWQQVNFPKSGESLGAAGTVFSRAPDLITYWSQARTVRGKGGKFLAIPTAYNIARGSRFGQKAVRISAAQMAKTKGAFVIKTKSARNSLWCLPVSKQASVSARGRRTTRLIVGSDIQVRGGKRFGSSSKSIRDRGFVPMFLLGKQVSFDKRIDLQGPLESVNRDLPGAIVRRWRFGSGKPAKSVRGA